MPRRIVSHRQRRAPRRSLIAIAIAVLALCALGIGISVGTGGSHGDEPPTAAQRADFKSILPAPVAAEPSGGRFTVTSATSIHAPSDSPAARAAADYLAALLRPATGYPLPVTSDGGNGGGGGGAISFVLTPGDKRLGAEGYRLDVTDDQITVTAAQPAGLFHATQTLRQLLPPQIESRSVQNAAWSVPSGTVFDYPRFAYRAAGLDVARHFFSVADVERYIDEIALYKINYLHLHLTDDQGWRLAIDGWPNLTGVGGQTEVGGGNGGFYTQDDYRKLVAYAQARYVTVIPEIDVPGHVTAALASYPALGCDGKARSVFTGIDTGFSSLCATKPVTGTFLDDVFRQVAALTPGPYVGIGGDEAQATSASDYAKVVDRAAADVRADGKTPWGWQETVTASIGTPSVATYWNPGLPDAAIKQAADAGTNLVLDPANHTYLDQKYDKNTTLGLHWAGYVEVQNAYDWDPGTYLPGVNSSAILGVEADLWTETVATTADIDYMAFPRLPASAELGWSPESTHSWSAFRQRLAAQGQRWSVMGIKYYRSPEIPW